MKLVVGLGNPGNQYAETRHNVGWMVLDRIADQAGKSGRGRERDASSVDRDPDGRAGARAREAADVHERLRGARSASCSRATTCRWSTCSSSRTTSRCRSASCGSARPGRTAGTTGCARSSTELDSEKYSRLRVGIGEPGRGAVDHVLSRVQHRRARPAADPPRRVRRGGRGVGEATAPRRPRTGSTPGTCRRPRPPPRTTPRPRSRARSAGPPTATASAARRPAGAGSSPGADESEDDKGGSRR